MKSTEQYFPVVLSILLYKLALSGRILNRHLLKKVNAPSSYSSLGCSSDSGEKDAWLIPLLFQINAPLIHSGFLINEGVYLYCKKKTAKTTKLKRRDKKWADFVSVPAAVVAVAVVFFF